MKYHIEKNTVQETLVIPLFGRLICSERFPELFADPEAKRICDSLDYDFAEKREKMESTAGLFGALEVAQRQKRPTATNLWRSCRRAMPRPSARTARSSPAASASESPSPARSKRTRHRSARRGDDLAGRENETKVQGALSRLLSGKTVLVIARRMRTVEAADRIVVLSDGRVVEEGRPEALLADEGSIFRRMTKLQAASANWSL